MNEETFVERRLAELCDRLDEMRRAPARRSLMRVRSVAHELDCTERHVRTLIASGALPAVRFGSESRVRATDLDAFLADLPAVTGERHLEAVPS